MAINAINTTGAPNELIRTVSSIPAGGGTGTYDFKLASTLDGGLVDVRICGKTACSTL